MDQGADDGFSHGGENGEAFSGIGKIKQSDNERHRIQNGLSFLLKSKAGPVVGLSLLIDGIGV